MNYRFERLEIWKLAIDYGMKIYRVTKDFPNSELFGLTSQLKRASLSISSNIAEGSGSGTTRDFCNFLDIAIKSCLETVSQIIFAKELGYLNDQKSLELYQDSEILIKKIRSLKAYLKKPRAPRPVLPPNMEVIHG